MANEHRPNDVVSGEVRACMARSRRTQGDLAEALGVSQPQVSARLAGRVDWSIDELAAVSTWLDVPLSELIRDAA